jgi:hypothetical protein
MDGKTGWNENGRALSLGFLKDPAGRFSLSSLLLKWH